MYKDVTLGHFSHKRGGRIFLAPGLNMEYDSGSASCMHEMYHEYFAFRTNVGVLMHLIELEIQLCDDDEYQLNLLNIRKALYNATRDIHEIYANSQEMLWLQENQEEGVWERIREQKTNEYKKYLFISEHIWNDVTQEISDRRKKLDDICMAILNLDVTTDLFWRYLIESGKEGNDSTLKGLISKRIVRAFDEGISHEESIELEPDDVVKLVSCRFRYLEPYFEDAYQQALEKTDVDLNGMLLETISTFELSELGIKIERKPRAESDVVFMVHNIRTIKGDFDNGLIQFSKKNCEYVLLDISKELMKETLLKQKYVVVQEDDFDFRKDKPKYIESGDATIFVLINDPKVFKNRISAIIEFEEMYIGDLNEKTQANFFTIIFARKRSCENVIYIFPTINVLANKVIEELELETQIRRPGSGVRFYDIFSSFDDWIEILQVLNNIVAFTTKSKGNILNAENKSAPLLNVVKYDIGNSILKIEVDNSFKIRAALPTLNTKPEPFWIIMEYVHGECTGNICSYKTPLETEEKRTGIIYFDNKNLAMSYLLQLDEERESVAEHKVVGLDEIAWKVLKPYLKQQNAGMLYYLPDGKGVIWNDVESFDYIRGKFK